MDLRTAARLLGGKVNGRGINCPGLGHSAHDESISVIFSPSAPDGLLVFDHAGGDHLGAKDYVRERLGLRGIVDNINNSSRATGHAVSAPRQVNDDNIHNDQGQRSRRRDVVIDDNVHNDKSSDNTALALRIWREAQPAAGSPVESYLVRRGLSLPDNAHEVIRYTPACPFAGRRTPAMVALVRNVVTDEPQAIHRTAITLEGQKAVVNGRDRLALGPLAGGAVMLTASAEVTYCLGVGEGIESVLSMRALPEFGERTPVWALLNTAGISGFMPLPGIESLWLAVDHDPGGEKAASACAGRWRFAGKETFLVRATMPGADLNDIVEARHG
ncbi:toprim domain-containing protein [Methylobacterium sp. J-030]|uniref:DUF7146 domain-containing protein n=1 Tax=Methylobacterium sp. J-030 TaxID=2836627 RepID=UPI001FB9260F|nr:toprim domain-containing protein [Methylobacterium sp. J-030]MCJ2069163.1 toprim domain-containing protein [Methylobacterium sp. J-030]